MLAVQARVGKFTERAGEFTFDPHDYFANDAHGVVLQNSHYNRGGKRLDADDIFIFHFRDGKVSEFWMSSEDQKAVDEFIG